MIHLPAKKRFSIFIISLSILCCATAVWLLFGKDTASAQTEKTAISSIAVTATGLVPARSVPLYGFNANNIRGPKWSAPGLLKQIKALQPQLIRYPGGSISDWWDWKTGWFVNSSALPQNYRKIPKVDMSLDELKKVVDATDCQVVFTLNMISASLADQMAMLQHAQQIGIPVKWVELGNESNLPKSAGMQKFKGAQLYATTSKNWIATIHSQFPMAKIAVVGGNSSGHLASLSSWNATVLKGASSTNAIVLHAYPHPVNVIDNNGISFEDIYNQFNTIIHNESLNNSKSLPDIWLTEYNIHWGYLTGVSDKTKALSYNSTWGEALSIVLMTSIATQELPNLKIVCDHNLTGWTPFAAIETTKKTFKLLPNGIGMQTWLQAAKGMTKMAKIKFSSSIKDYQLFGWKFFNGSNQKVILVNMTNTSMAVNLNAINLLKTTRYNILYASKNQQVIGLTSVQKTTGTIKQGKLILPPFSITNLGQS